MVYLNAHYSVLWGFMGYQVSVIFLQQLDLKNKYKTKVQLYLFGINRWKYFPPPPSQSISQ